VELGQARSQEFAKGDKREGLDKYVSYRIPEGQAGRSRIACFDAEMHQLVGGLSR